MKTATTIFSSLICSALLGCGGDDQLFVIPDEPDSGVHQDAVDVLDSGTLDAWQNPPRPDAGCDPATHEPEPCQLAGCFGAVLCNQGRLQCVVPPDCTTPIDPGDTCSQADYVFIFDRSGSMTDDWAGIQAITSSLASDRVRRNYFMIDVPQFGSADAPSTKPGPNRLCYPIGSGFPIGPCPFVDQALADLPLEAWGGYEHTWDALAEIESSILWTPGSSRHVFLFTDEPGQGATYDQYDVVDRLRGRNIRVHIYAIFQDDFKQIANTTQGTVGGLSGPDRNPCP